MLHLSTSRDKARLRNSPGRLGESRTSTGMCAYIVPKVLSRNLASNMPPGSTVTVDFRRQSGVMPSDLINDGIVADIRANTPI